MPQIILGIVMVALFIAGTFCAIVLFMTVGVAYGCFSAIANYAQAFRDNVKFERPSGTL